MPRPEGWGTVMSPCPGPRSCTVVATTSRPRETVSCSEPATDDTYPTLHRGPLTRVLVIATAGMVVRRDSDRTLPVAGLAISRPPSAERASATGLLAVDDGARPSPLKM